MKTKKRVEFGRNLILTLEMTTKNDCKFKVLNIKDTVRKEEAETLYEIIGE